MGHLSQPQILMQTAPESLWLMRHGEWADAAWGMSMLSPRVFYSLTTHELLAISCAQISGSHLGCNIT